MPKISFRIRSEKSQAGIYVYLYPSKKSRIEFPVGISIRTAYWDKRKMRMTDGAQEGVGHGIILGRRQQKISFGFINQDYGTGVIEVVFP